MTGVFLKGLMGASLATVAFAATGAAEAQTTFFGTPNRATGLGPVSTTFSGQTFVNQGMVGAGRALATSKDFNGDSLGSFSGMALDLSTWGKTSSGYAARLYTLPDRGYNIGATIDDFTNYAGRINVFDIAFTPYTGATLPQSINSQNQVQMTYNAGASFFLRDFNGNPTTGEDPAASTTVQNGYTLPVVAAGREGAGRVSIDAEALVFRRDGTFYVGDEYTGGIYQFDATGKMMGFIAPPGAILPKSAGVTNFTSFAQPSTSGRRNNQGMEAASLTPDGNTLMAVLQSSTVQDSITANQATRLNTRVLIYDVSTNATPSAPTAHYVLQLPTFDKDGVNGAADRTAAQSEILALNNTQFLMLTRDGAGLDNGNADPIMFKSIYLVDTTGATNLAGTAQETGATPISPNGVLSASITPVKTAQFVNMLNVDQLTRFGMNLDTDLSTLTRTNDRTTLSEKWEAMALAPVLDDAAPQDFFLFLGNDNDFKTRQGVMKGDAQYNTYDAGVENDNVLLVYRVTLPTYVDPTWRRALEEIAPVSIGALGAGVDALSQENSINIASHLDAARQSRLAGREQTGGAFSVWGGFGYSRIDADEGISERLGDFTLGAGYALTPNLEIGVAVGYQAGEGDSDNQPFSFDHSATKYSAYAGYTSGPMFANLSYTYGDLSFEDINRPAGYGQTATGDTDGTSDNVRFEAGYLFDLGGMYLGPVAGGRWMSATLDGYTETGASGGSIAYGDIDVDSETYFAGGEWVMGMGDITPSIRVLYNFTDDGLAGASARLASAQSISGQATLKVPDLDEDFVSAEFALTGGDKFLWRVGYSAEVGVDSNDLRSRVFASIGARF